jgi:hypothetical protein
MKFVLTLVWTVTASSASAAEFVLKSPKAHHCQENYSLTLQEVDSSGAGVNVNYYCQNGRYVIDDASLRTRLNRVVEPPPPQCQAHENGQILRQQVWDVSPNSIKAPTVEVRVLEENRLCLDGRLYVVQPRETVQLCYTVTSWNQNGELVCRQ